MKAITLTQPYATLVALGAKAIETRGWALSYRGPLAIHAGKNLGPVGGKAGLGALVASEPFFTTLVDTVEHTPGVSLVDQVVGSLPLGAIVAVVDLVDCVSTAMLAQVREIGRHRETVDVIWQMTDRERAFGDYSPGRYGWLLDDVQRLGEPVACTGRLGLWDVPAEVEARILAQLAEPARTADAEDRYNRGGW